MCDYGKSLVIEATPKPVLDLRQLDTMPSDLHLIVDAAKMIQPSIPPAHAITGAVVSSPPPIGYER